MTFFTYRLLASIIEGSFLKIYKNCTLSTETCWFLQVPLNLAVGMNPVAKIRPCLVLTGPDAKMFLQIYVSPSLHTGVNYNISFSSYSVFQTFQGRGPLRTGMSNSN